MIYKSGVFHHNCVLTVAQVWVCDEAPGHVKLPAGGGGQAHTLVLV